MSQLAVPWHSSSQSQSMAAPSAKAKQKRTPLSLQQKIEILDKLDMGQNRNEIAKEYNTDPTNLSKLKKKKDELRQRYSDGIVSVQCKKMWAENNWVFFNSVVKRFCIKHWRLIKCKFCVWVPSNHESQDSWKLCGVCNLQCGFGHICQVCLKAVHATCGATIGDEEGYGAPVICYSSQ